MKSATKKGAVNDAAPRSARFRARRVRGGVAIGIALLVLLGAGVVSAAGQDPVAPVVVDLNSASAEDLQQLPGIGEVKAQAIVAARKQRGGFSSVDELVEVKGVGPALVEKLRPHLKVAGGNPAHKR